MRRIVGVTMCTLSFAALVGCDSQDPASSQVTVAGLQSQGAATRTAEEVVARAKSAASSASSFRVTGTVPTASGVSEFDLHFTDTGVVGSMTQGWSSFDIIATGDTVYVRGDQEFNQQAGGDAQSQYAGKWLAVPADDERARSFTGFANAQDFLDDTLNPANYPDLGSEKSLGGQPCIEVSGENRSLWVASGDQPPYPVQISANDGVNHLDFAEWNQHVNITAPPADEVLSLPPQ